MYRRCLNLFPGFWNCIDIYGFVYIHYYCFYFRWEKKRQYVTRWVSLYAMQNRSDIVAKMRRVVCVMSLNNRKTKYKKKKKRIVTMVSHHKCWATWMFILMHLFRLRYIVTLTSHTWSLHDVMQLRYNICRLNQKSQGFSFKVGVNLGLKSISVIYRII